MKEQEKWFSWGWLILWFIIEPIFALIYLIIKHCDKEDKEKKK